MFYDFMKVNGFYPLLTNAAPLGLLVYVKYCGGFFFELGFYRL